ncbi:MAG: helix-turn-helix domain-containing protein [Planctomycetota bacterium]
MPRKVDKPTRPPADARSVCPVACTLDLIGDRWTLLVVRDLFAGKRQFKEFADAPESIATNILASRLKLLVDHGLVERSVNESARGKPVIYDLTQRGRSLEPLLTGIAEWGLKHIPGTKMRITPKSAAKS